MIRILYFASLRERVGCAGESLALASGIDTPAKLIALLRERGDPWATALAEGEPVMIAVNQMMARSDSPLADGDELALFPPVTGG